MDDAKSPPRFVGVDLASRQDVTALIIADRSSTRFYGVDLSPHERSALQRPPAFGWKGPYG